METNTTARSRYTYNRVTYPYYWSLYDGEVANSYIDSFWVSGFDTPIGRKFVDATPGEYVKSHWNYLYGTRERRELGVSGDLQSLQEFRGDLSIIGHGGGLIYTQAFLDTYGSYDNERYNRAIEKLYDGIRQTETNLALTIGEARESGKMLQVGKSVYQVLTLARRAKRDFLRNPSKKLSEIWLGYKLGWMPLLTDIHNYLKWSYTSFDEGVPVVGRSRVTQSIVQQQGTISSPEGGSRATGHAEHKCEVKCWVGLSNTEAYNLSRVTSLNPLAIAWELVPLSFVVDWFYNIGGWLQNMESALGAGVTFKRGYYTEVAYFNAKENWTIDYTWSTWPGTTRMLGSAVGSRIVARKRRFKLSALPFPRAPTLRLKLGGSQLITAAALLRVILLGKVR